MYAQNRFVATDAWDPDAPEGEGSAGAVRGWTRRPGGWLKNVFRTPAKMLNTNVMLKGGKLYARCEGSKPTEVDPVTLETLAESDLGGIQVTLRRRVVVGDKALAAQRSQSITLKSGRLWGRGRAGPARTESACYTGDAEHSRGNIRRIRRSDTLTVV